MINLTEQTAAAVSATILLIDYLIGVTFGMFGGVIFGSLYENHRMSLLEEAPDPLSAGARVILGLFTRDDGYLRSLPPRGRSAGDGSHGDPPSGSHGQGLDQ